MESVVAVTFEIKAPPPTRHEERLLPQTHPKEDVSLNQVTVTRFAIVFYCLATGVPFGVTTCRVWVNVVGLCMEMVVGSEYSGVPLAGV